MKAKTIWMIVGVVLIIAIIIYFYNKSEKKRVGGNVGNKSILSCECPPGSISDCVVSDFSFRGCKWCCSQPIVSAYGRTVDSGRVVRKK